MTHASKHAVQVVHVFSDGPGGGNPAPIVLDASGMSPLEMQRIAQQYGHESGFVVAAREHEDVDFHVTFWTPLHEMSMCGHVTVGAMWLLHRLGQLDAPTVRIGTASGIVEARVDATGAVEVAQPAGTIEAVSPDVAASIIDVLGIAEDQLAPLPIRNATTSRTKTLVPLVSTDVLDGLTPDLERIEAVCALAESTGLYPYAVTDTTGLVFDARQFPRSSGYPEDAATGVAAAALVTGLVADGLVDPTAARAIRVRQGRAMGRPSEISIRTRASGGVWLGGRVR